jgi:hypothetical protein
MKANQQTIWDLTQELSEVLTAEYMKRTGCGGHDARAYATGYTWSMLASFIDQGLSRKKVVAAIQARIAEKAVA